MTPVRSAALTLRLQGYSYNEIKARLGVPKATLSGWFSQLVLSEKAHHRLKMRVCEGAQNGLVKRNKLQTHLAVRRANQARQEGRREIELLTKHDLHMIGVALYWGEGHKKALRQNGRQVTAHAINFTNADPEMIRMFMRFVREVLEVPDECIKINLRLFSQDNEQASIAFWANVTGLTPAHFQKTTYVISKSSQGKRKYNNLQHGTIQVRINNTPLFHHLMGWIEGVAAQGR